MRLVHLTLILFCLGIFVSCTKEADVVEPRSEKSEFIGDFANLNISVYDAAASNNCENGSSGCPSNAENSKVGMEATVMLFDNIEDFEMGLSPSKQVDTDQSGFANFELLSQQEYYLHVTSASGSRSFQINTPWGKTSSVSIGL